MENLVEQVVSRNKNFVYYVKVVVAILIAVLVPVTFFVLGLTIPQAYLIYIAVFTIPFMIYFAWLYISSQKVDFEYALLGSSFNIAKIIAKRKRKLLLKVDVKTFNDLFKYDDKKMLEKKFTKVYFVASDNFSEDNYVACFHSDARGNSAIIFSPNEKLLNSMKPFLNYEIVKKVFF